jgi:hypothetical protein
VSNPTRGGVRKDQQGLRRGGGGAALENAAIVLVAPDDELGHHAQTFDELLLVLALFGRVDRDGLELCDEVPEPPRERGEATRALSKAELSSRGAEQDAPSQVAGFGGALQHLQGVLLLRRLGGPHIVLQPPEGHPGRGEIDQIVAFFEREYDGREDSFRPFFDTADDVARLHELRVQYFNLTTTRALLYGPACRTMTDASPLRTLLNRSKVKIRLNRRQYTARRRVLQGCRGAGAHQR